MAKIEVIRGACGISYTDQNGVLRHMAKTAKDGAFTCEDAQAERLVRLGAARYAEERKEEPLGAPGQEQAKPAEEAAKPKGKKKPEPTVEGNDGDEPPEVNVADPV